jgi:outer membrane protein assembly factor BamB
MPQTLALTMASAAWLTLAPLAAAQVTEWGGSPGKNNVSAATGLAVEWNVGRFDRATGAWEPDGAENIRWVARLGSQTYGTPMISGSQIFVATNNGAGYVPRYPADVDLGCLLCFGVKDGRFGWQLSREKLAEGRAVDWPEQGICCAPLIGTGPRWGERLWVVTNRGEVACLDRAGFYDGQNDGPYRDEPDTDRREADIVWLFDMMDRLGTRQHNMCSCSVTAAGDLLFVNTGNGVDESHGNIPAPDAPSFIALNRETGELVWADASPDGNLLHGQWCSPAYGELGGIPQAIFPAGDGWVYSFRAQPAQAGTKKPELLWKFDCNAKTAEWVPNGMGEKNNIIATPVIHENRVYIATGQDPEHGEGQGRLWCIDPTRHPDFRGDMSPELVVDAQGNPVAPRRTVNCDPARGESTRPNPHSAAVWCYTGEDADGDGELSFEETMHRSLSMAVIADGLLIIPDTSGLIHCVDLTNGRPLWTYDALAGIWGSPLVADGRVYIGDEDGDVAVFELAREKNLLAENYMEDAVYGTPVAVGRTLYIATQSHLVAIGKP